MDISIRLLEVLKYQQRAIDIWIELFEELKYQHEANPHIEAHRTPDSDIGSNQISTESCQHLDSVIRNIKISRESHGHLDSVI